MPRDLWPTDAIDDLIQTTLEAALTNYITDGYLDVGMSYDGTGTLVLSFTLPDRADHLRREVPLRQALQDYADRTSEDEAFMDEDEIRAIALARKLIEVIDA